ncbi:MAG: hypothetical protein LBJ63_06540 [Prevotellaceae bacterium]|jgi:hypothetical protein|nr:hypothetical protein [Prevotellaceae bacterium]
MAQMSLEVQIQKMLEMRGTLHDFCKMLDARMDGLNDKLNEYVMQGFPTEIASTYYSRYYMNESQAINNLTQVVQTSHYDYIDNVVSDLKISLGRQ